MVVSQRCLTVGRPPDVAVASRRPLAGVPTGARVKSPCLTPPGDVYGIRSGEDRGCGRDGRPGLRRWAESAIRVVRRARDRAVAPAAGRAAARAPAAGAGGGAAGE